MSQSLIYKSRQSLTDFLCPNFREIRTGPSLRRIQEPRMEMKDRCMCIVIGSIFN